MKGPLAAATVMFGSWRTDLSLDRFPNVSSPPPTRIRSFPHQVTIKAGGSVAFIISGLHQILVYGPDVLPDSINAQMTRPSTGTPSGRRSSTTRQTACTAAWIPACSRASASEVVNFHAEGKYLVICGVQSHFVNDQMYGWVRVLPADSDD